MSKYSNFYAHKIVLAPMVRENNLPFRLLCLKYGADLVYTEELIDHRLSECRRLSNKVLNTFDYVDRKGEVILRIHPEESGRLVLQLGSNNPERALKAAKLVSKDIAALDFNFGCPKSFSLSGGMGAALLDKPDQIKALLTKCVEHLDIPISCKIRLLPNLEDTLELVRMIESCGVSAIAVHGRTKEQRSQHENQDDHLMSIAECIKIPMIANGGSNHIKSYSDILNFRDKTKASSVMIARVAMRNPSIFKSDNVLEPIKIVIEKYLKLAVKFNNYVANTKYTIQSMLAGGHSRKELVQKFHSACDFMTLCDVFDLSDWYAKNKPLDDKSKFYDAIELDDPELKKMIDDKRNLCERYNIEFICDNIPYIAKVYGSTSPKSQLISYVNKKNVSNDERPQFDVIALNQHRYYCLISFDGRCYLNKTFSTSKKGAEHATAMLLCENLCLIDLDDYKDRTLGSNRNIN